MKKIVPQHFYFGFHAYLLRAGRATYPAARCNFFAGDGYPSTGGIGYNNRIDAARDQP